MLTCSRCKLEKNEEEFFINKARERGRVPACKACMCKRIVTIEPKPGYAVFQPILKKIS